MEKIKITIITVEGKVEDTEINNTLKAMQEVVGGLIEFVYNISPGKIMVVNEEGIPLGLEQNYYATLLCERLPHCPTILGQVFMVNKEDLE